MTHAPAFTRLRPALLAATALALPLPGCDTMNEWRHPTPAIRFAAAGDTWLKKPDPPCGRRTALPRIKRRGRPSDTKSLSF